jgi:photosystem II stability/assembly factor-like uncharacterized protein
MTPCRAVFTASILLAGCTGGPRPVEDGETTGGIEAVGTWYEQRADKHGKIPPNAIMNAKRHRDAMAPAGSADGPGWTWIGPGNIGGRIRAMVIHPTTPTTMWIGAASGGIWKTTNGGTNWTPMDDFVPSLCIGSLILDPSNPDVLYAGTGEGVFNTPQGSSNTAAPQGAGIFKSTDGGQTWTQLPSTVGANWYFVNRLAFQPGSNQVMLAATNTGLYRSTDAGTTWQQVTTGQTLDVQFHPTDPLRAVAGRNDGLGQHSIDGGLTWLNATGIATGSTRVELTYAPSNPTIVYGAVAAAGRLKVYRSTNNGQTYTLMTSGTGLSTLGSYTGAIWVDLLNSNAVILGAQALARSSDGGVTLPGAFSGVHADHHMIVPHPQFNGSTNRTIYFAGDGGIYRANDWTLNTVTELNNNMGITQFYGGSINDATGVVLAGAQDNFTLRFSGNPEGWTQTYGGDGGYTASDPTDPNYFYGESQRLNIVRSTNGGVSASPINAGITEAGSQSLVNFIPYFMLDPNNPNTMLAGARSLWRSTNVKAAPPSWSIIKTGLESGGGGPDPDHYIFNDPRNISTIAVAQGNSSIIWVGHNNGQVWKTSNGTAATPTWTRVDTGAPGLPARWISRIVIDPSDHSRVYVSLMGYNADNIWRTTNAGATWQNISGTGPGALPAIPVPSLALHRTVPGRLYAGTDIGLFLSTNDGASWGPLSPGIGLVPVVELIWRNNTTLMAVTHGRGIYLGDATVAVCYANCDGSTGTQLLTANDFACFLNAYAAGQSYADCDGVGGLTANDFSCFLNAYAGGCP